MKTTLAIALIGLSCLAAAANPEQWYVHYRIVSNLGGEGGIQIFSDGRTAVCAGESCSELKYCDDVTLGSDETDRITADLVALAVAMPAGSSLTLDDKCEDESEHNVLVQAFGKTRLFQYTALEECRSINEVPVWMVALTDKLQGIKERMKPCMDAAQIDK